MDEKTIETLQSGGLVVFPTDTVYGLLCDASNNEAVEKLISFKERPAGKPISIFVSDLEMAKKYVQIDEETVRRLQTFLPGPYTLVLRTKHKLPQQLESENGTLAIRIPDNKRIIDLVKTFGKPLTATSANLAGRTPHYSLSSFHKQVSQGRVKLINLMVDGGELPHHKPSTVIDFTTSDLKVLRMGDGSVSDERHVVSTSEDETKKIAKYMLEQAKIESPGKPIVFILKGDLGAGKTVFAKGLGEALGISNIISPTFVVYYEYDIPNAIIPKSKFIHVDLYNVGDKEEFKHLGLENYLKDGTIMCIEWGEKVAEIISEIVTKAYPIYIHIKHIDEVNREIAISRKHTR